MTPPLLLVTLSLACHGRGVRGEQPTGEELFAAYIEATHVGDDGAWERSDKRVQHGTFSMPRQGISSTMVARFERPDHFMVAFEFPGIGHFEDGYDGEVAWSVDPTQGPRIKDPDEALRTAFDASFDGDDGWQDRYTDFRVMGLDECEDKGAWEVRMATSLGDERRYWFDRKTGLLACSRIEVKGAFGSVKTNNVYRDWEEVEGRLVPMTTVQEAMMMEIVMTTELIDLDPREFEPIEPHELVKELLEDPAAQ